MDKKEFTASNFIPEKPLDIICILERDEKPHSFKIIMLKRRHRRTTFPLKNKKKQKQHVIRTRNKFLPKTSCVNQSERVERKKSSPRASGKSASQHTDKNQDSSNVRQAEQPKLKKKIQAQVARDRARRKSYWKRIKLTRQLRKAQLRA